MLHAIFLAHLLGDYVFQGDLIAAWKSKSIAGVLVHGAIVTLCTWLCSLVFSPAWWPYALLIGAAHVAIDIARTRVGKVRPGFAKHPERSRGTSLLLLLFDQAVHALVIVLVVRLSGWLGARPAQHPIGAWLQVGGRLPFAIGYVLLTMPAWVLVHYIVNSTGAVSKSLPGRPGEKYVGMLERALIATFVLLGHFFAVPLVLAPRLVLDGPGGRLGAERIGYLGELLVSLCLAVAVGLFLRRLL